MKKLGLDFFDSGRSKNLRVIESQQSVKLRLNSAFWTGCAPCRHSRSKATREGAKLTSHKSIERATRPYGHTWSMHTPVAKMRTRASILHACNVA